MTCIVGVGVAITADEEGEGAIDGIAVAKDKVQGESSV